MFIETSAPRVRGDKAWLLSDQLQPTTGSCLTFWYSMYGSGKPPELSWNRMEIAKKPSDS